MLGVMLSIAACLGADAAPAEFTITVPREKDRVHVTASYTLHTPELRMFEGAYSKGVAGGLSGFVENLRMTRPDGASAELGKSVGGRWRVDTPAGERVALEYDVRLDHEKAPWPFGADEIAYTRDDSVFFVSRTVLIVNEQEQTARVRFVVPGGWRVAVPWQPVEGESHTFDVAGLRPLVQGVVLVGDFVQKDIRAGDTFVTLAVSRALESKIGALESGLQAAAPAFSDLFGESPHARFLAVVNVNAEGPITNGSAYPNGVSILTPLRMEGQNYVQAIYTIAHELLHLWNGERMQSAEQMEWFREGFTDYVTWRTLAQLRLVDERAQLIELQRQLAAYTNLNREGSIADAGDQKARNATLVYEGGSLAALCLDSLIREYSGGGRGLNDFMREVYHRSAQQGEKYDAALIVAVASEMAGRDLAGFFERHVEGTDPLPLDERLAAMGLQVGRTDSTGRVSFRVTPDESAKGDRAAARDAFLGRN